MNTSKVKDNLSTRNKVADGYLLFGAQRLRAHGLKLFLYHFRAAAHSFRSDCAIEVIATELVVVRSSYVFRGWRRAGGA